MEKFNGFRFIIADTEKLLNDIYKLRYQVYVQELGAAVPEALHLCEQEKDKYDHCSVHFAAINQQEEVVGTLRLVMNTQEGLPIKRIAAPILPDDELGSVKLAEISRLAIQKPFRRILGNDLEVVRDGSEKKRKFPLVLIGLYRIMYQTSKELGITRWCMLSETKLYRLLKSYGFMFYATGHEVEYYGLRTPYMGIISEFEQHLSKKNPNLFDWFSSDYQKNPTGK
jgi:N-acyl amino acid synthase of PEP-CTERM/exosortase system